MKHSLYKYILLLLICSTSLNAQDKIKWSLKDCINYAIANNLNIKQAQNSIEENKLTKEINKWSRLPDVNASVGQNWNWGRSKSPKDNNYTNVRSANANFGISTQVPIFTGLELPNQYKLSKLNLEASIADLNKAKDDLAINVTSQYIQVLFNKELVQVANNQVNLSAEQLNRGKELYDIGKLSKAELSEQYARLKQDEMRHIEAQNNLQLAILDLSQSLELESPDNFDILPIHGALNYDLTISPNDIYQSALLLKPEIRAAMLRNEGAERSIKIARSRFMPRLSFNANLGTGYYTMQGIDAKGFRNQISDNLSKFVGFSLSIPIFNRLNTLNQVKTAKTRHHTQILDFENKKKALYKEIQQAWYNTRAAEVKYEASNMSLKANEESFKLMKEKYELGKANNVEFNEAKLNLMKAESDMLQAKYDYFFRTKLLDFYKGIPIE